ncbi:MAG: ChaN family lipoprotein [Gammaproteobacteria bacterium]
MPQALSMAGGELASSEVLDCLDTGLYISNLWYCNYSDRNAGRITGMTRFATFWVEHGQLREPVNVMRFDDTIYNLLGQELLALTRERELLLDAGSYEHRSRRSSELPGLVVKPAVYVMSDKHTRSLDSMPPTRTACSISLAATLLLVACTGTGPVNPAVAPAATVAPVAPAADPLLDRIIATADGRPLQPTELYERMAQTDVVYLAEKHDNPRHHALQLEALRTLLEAGKRPALGFEFFAREQTGYLQDFVQPQNSYGKPLSPAQVEQKLRRELGWGPQRDAEWAFYFRCCKWRKNTS